MLKLPPPYKIALHLPLRKLLGSRSHDRVKLNGAWVMVRGFCISYHDLAHLEVSCLERVQIGKHQVSGIHGLNCAVFHDTPIVEEYDGILDEVRVVFHEFLTRPSVFTTLKLLIWTVWLVQEGMNPIAILVRHARALYVHQSDQPLMPLMTLVEPVHDAL